MAGVSEKSSEWSLMALRVGSVVVLLGAWEFTARLHIFSDFLLPSLSTVLLRLFHDTVSGDLVHGITLTLIRTAIGFVAAAVAGVALGVGIARVPVMRWFFDPLVSAGLPMPKIAFLPIFMLWFGVFDASKIMMIAFSAVFPPAASNSSGRSRCRRRCRRSSPGFKSPCPSRSSSPSSARCRWAARGWAARS